ncbi:MAG: DUF4160 domain-containing protein, partial [Vicinamibacterales bacterium]
MAGSRGDHGSKLVGRTWIRCVDDEIIGSDLNVPRISGIPGPYWLFFYSFDCSEPVHVHARRERNQAKFWVDPVVLAWNRGFSPRELNEIRRIIIENEARII